MSLPVQVPSVPVNFVPVKGGDIIKLGQITCRVLEDGSRTGKSRRATPSRVRLMNIDNRIGCAEFTLPPHTSGPPSHFHMMHDETFLTTQGTIRYQANPILMRRLAILYQYPRERRTHSRTRLTRRPSSSTRSRPPSTSITSSCCPA